MLQERLSVGGFSREVSVGLIWGPHRSGDGSASFAMAIAKARLPWCPLVIKSIFGETQDADLQFPINRKVNYALKAFGSEIDGLPTVENGTDDVGREEGQGDLTTDFAGWNIFTCGDGLHG